MGCRRWEDLVNAGLSRQPCAARRPC